MSAGNFSLCLAFTLSREGQYSNDPHDPGGATMEGIIQTEYDRWKLAHGLPKVNVRWISNADRDAIYLANYWTPSKCEQLAKGVDLMVFDYSVNSGTGRSIKELQKAVGTYPDGVMGPATLLAASKMQPADLINKLAARRLSFLQALLNWKYFGKGWKARVLACQAAALRMI